MSIKKRLMERLGRMVSVPRLYTATGSNVETWKTGSRYNRVREDITGYKWKQPISMGKGGTGQYRGDVPGGFLPATQGWQEHFRPVNPNPPRGTTIGGSSNMAEGGTFSPNSGVISSIESQQDGITYEPTEGLTKLDMATSPSDTSGEASASGGAIASGGGATQSYGLPGKPKLRR